jgi:hypothetical protein
MLMVITRRSYLINHGKTANAKYIKRGLTMMTYYFVDIDNTINVNITTK